MGNCLGRGFSVQLKLNYGTSSPENSVLALDTKLQSSTEVQHFGISKYSQESLSDL